MPVFHYKSFLALYIFLKLTEHGCQNVSYFFKNFCYFVCFKQCLLFFTSYIELCYCDYGVKAVFKTLDILYVLFTSTSIQSP